MIARKLGIIAIGVTLVLVACSKTPQPPIGSSKPKPEPTQPSAIKVELKPGGPVVLTTSAAEFQVNPDGYMQAFLLKDGQKLSLDEPRLGVPSDSDYVRVAGKDVHFTLDF